MDNNNSDDPRKIRVCKCLGDLNPRGWINVQTAMNILRWTRCRLCNNNNNNNNNEIIITDSMVELFNLFPKQRPWYFGVKCDRLLLSAVFQAAVEYIFDVDLKVSPEHWLIFHDPVSGCVYEVTDKWFDFWFLIVRRRGDSSDDNMSTCSDCTICETSDSMAEFDELSLLGDLIQV